MSVASWQEFNAALGRAMPHGWDPEATPRSPLARSAQPDEIAVPDWRWASGTATVLLGRYQDRLIGRVNDDRHIVTVAGSRAGKGRSLILPNLATWPGSVIAIDLKGELAAKTARWRAEGLKQHVVVLDPYGTVCSHAHCFGDSDANASRSDNCQTFQQLCASDE